MKCCVPLPDRLSMMMMDANKLNVPVIPLANNPEEGVSRNHFISI